MVTVYKVQESTVSSGTPTVSLISLACMYGVSITIDKDIKTDCFILKSYTSPLVADSILRFPTKAGVLHYLATKESEYAQRLGIVYDDLVYALDNDIQAVFKLY